MSNLIYLLNSNSCLSTDYFIEAMKLLSYPQRTITLFFARLPTEKYNQIKEKFEANKKIRIGTGLHNTFLSNNANKLEKAFQDREKLRSFKIMNQGPVCENIILH